MKKTFTLLCIAALAACEGGSNLPPSTGNARELLVVCPDRVCEGAAGDELRKVLCADFPALNQPEPMFEVVHITRNGYISVLPRHRNQLIISVDPSLAKTGYITQHDLHATPQVIVTLSAPSDAALVEYLRSHSGELAAVFSAAERQRAIAAIKTHRDKQIEHLVEDRFGLRIVVPYGYQLRGEAEDFAWISMEYPAASQGFFVYSYPGSEADLAPDRLLIRRNQFAARIPGEAEGSHMATSGEIPPLLGEVLIGDRKWVEMRNFWEVAGDFMGGPFVSYSALDTVAKRIVTIDCYVYSPKAPKRNLVLGLENIALTASLK